MIRIRFHGRGGHGVKTAGRIVGTAAFLAGYQVQDSPVYGAERRGAAVAAYARIDKSPILERGLIESPDLIVIADETLLDDRAAAVLAGQESAAAVFVNVGPEAGLAKKYNILPPLLTYDITARTRQVLGMAAALSAGLGAAAAKLTGLIGADQLAEAIREELRQLHAVEEVIDKNVAIAKEVFAALASLPVSRAAPKVTGQIQAVGYDPAAVGTSSIIAPGNAARRNTGTWRVERPEIDHDVCTRCGLCVLGCPEGAIALDKEGFPVIDYDHCKGCMICAQLCPLHGIGRTKEVRSW
ncbi:MAG: 2-oxoacid:acceptor oxidoreductase family protein [Deltaproteobacteria bacterium]